MTKEIHDINARAVDFVAELIDYIFEYPDDDYMTMECLCRKLVKHGLLDKADGYYQTHDNTEPSNSEKPNNCEPKICDTCRYYNSYIPCGSTPDACKNADKFAEEFVDGLKKLKPQTEPQTYCDNCMYLHCNYECAGEIVHKMIDDAVIAEDVYPDLRQRMHDAVDEYEPQTEREGE